MQVLWVTAELPDRDLGGGNIRQSYLLSSVAAAFDTDLLVAGHVRDEQLRQRLRRVLEVKPAPPFAWPNGRWTRRWAELTAGIPGREPFEVMIEAGTRRRLAAALPDGGYDVVVVQHAAMAPILPDARSCPWVLELHNLASDRSRQMAAIADHGRHRWMWLRDAAHASRMERWAARAYDGVIVCSPDDAAGFPGPTVVVPNGVDTTRFAPTPLPAEPGIVLTASFNYPPNVDGAAWFCDEVLPRIRARVAGAELTLVGREPGPGVRALADRPGVRTAFDVPAVEPYLAAARVAVVPIRVGTGTRLKALQALAAGRPLAGTTTGLAGVGLANGQTAVIADDPDELAAGIVRLLEDDDASREMAVAGRRLVEERFDWSAIGDQYVDALARVAAASRSTAA